MSAMGPLETVRRLIDAVNAGDGEAAAQVCTEETTITTPDGAVVTGTDGIRAFVAALAGRGARLELQGAQVRGDAVTGSLQLANDYHRQVGVAPLYVHFRAQARDGVVQSFGGPFTEASRQKLEPLRASDRFYEALNQLIRGNPTPMVEVWSHAPDVSTMHPLGGREIGWERVRDVWEKTSRALSTGSAEIAGVRVADLVLLPLGEGLACTLGMEVVEVSAGSERVSLESRVTNVFRREGDAWKMVHHHVDAFPPDILRVVMGQD